jgi:RNA polymerase sigma-70 factor (ECF subfamily)
MRSIGLSCNIGSHSLVTLLSNDMYSQQDLVRDCLRGDPRAQRALYDTYAEVMLGVCCRYIRTQADAEDVLQEAFVRVFTRLGQYRGSGELGGWIRRIVVHTALNFLKRPSRIHEPLSFTEGGPEPVSDLDPVPDLEAKELAAMIRSLPAGFRTVFNLYAIEGYSHAEIASLMNIREVTSRSQYLRARTALADMIRQHHASPSQTKMP